MDENYDLLELERNGKKVKFKVGAFEPRIGDYLVDKGGELHKVETAGQRSTPDGKMFYIETSMEPGILRRVHPKMKFAKLID
ncbi:MAG: hypothetical protein JW716_00585 [Candidatus Aenigmarchaeota archaeon]|nr:hypothetical protein [Candidatus Aenigmarchaeota archaeon]